MKFLKGLLITVFVLFVVIAVGGYFALKNFDLNKYRPLIAKEVTKSIGRDFSFGEASVKMSLVPTIVVKDVKLANASWATEPYMVNAEKIELVINIKPLLKKDFVVKNFVLDNAKIYLETNAQGIGNWVFETKKEEEKQSFKFELISSANAQTTTNDFKIPNISLENIAINKGFVKFNDHNIDINTFKFEMLDKNSDIKADFDIAYNGDVFVGSSVLGSINKLTSKNENYPLDISVLYRGIKAEANGFVIGVMSSNPSVNLSLDVYKPNGNMDLPEIKLSADVKASLKSVDVDIKELDIASNLVSGRVSANLEGRTFVDAYLSSDKIDVESFKAAEPIAFVLPSLISSANATTLVEATPIDYELLKLIDGKLKLDVKTLVVNKDVVLGDVSLTANLNDGNLLLKPAEFMLGQGDIFATATIDATNKTINANIKSQNLKLQDVSKEFVVENQSDFGFVSGGGLDLDINLISTGATTKDLLENLDGRVIAIVDKSVVKTGDSKLLTGFIGTVIDTLKIASVEKNKEVDLSCAVVKTDIKKGVLNIDKSVAVQSNDLSLVVNGYVSLGNDKIALDLHPYAPNLAKTGLASALGGFLKITGTIQKPAIALDEKQALKTIVGVLTTGGASYVGSQVVLDATSSPCYTALAGTGYENRFPKPTKAAQVYDNSAKQVDEGVKKIQDATKKLGENLGNLFKSF